MERGPIYDMQRCLRMIWRVHDDLPCVVADGVYGEKTRDAVMQIQKESGLEPTGNVDSVTWDKISSEYEKAKLQSGAPGGVRIMAKCDFECGMGESAPRLSVLQAMINVMSKRFDNLPEVTVNGVYDSETESAVSAFRKIFDMEDGGIDALFWQRFACIYESSVLPYEFTVPEGEKTENAAEEYINEKGDDDEEFFVDSAENNDKSENLQNEKESGNEGESDNKSGRANSHQPLTWRFI